MRDISEIADFIDQLKFSKEGPIEKVAILKRFLTEEKKVINDETHETIKDELQSFKDLAHFEATTPW